MVIAQMHRGTWWGATATTNPHRRDVWASDGCRSPDAEKAAEDLEKIRAMKRARPMKADGPRAASSGAGNEAP